MSSMQPDQAKFLLHAIFLPALEKEHPVTRRVIEAIPLNNGDYRPEPTSKTALELAWHIAAAEKRFLNGIAAGQFDFTAINRPDSVKNSADLGRWYADMFQSAFGRLQQLSAEQLIKVIDFRGLFQFPAVVYFQFSLNHS